MPLRTSLYRKSVSIRWPQKQKCQERLSVNMISLPLGDFRHLSHVGLDTLGNISNFGSVSDNLQQSSDVVLHGAQSHSHQDLLRTGPPPPKPPRLLSREELAGGEKAFSRDTKSHSRSLPLLDAAMLEEQGVEEEKEGDIGTELDCPTGAGIKRLFPKLDTHFAEDDLPFSLNLDLGPSILADVLQVMDTLHH